MRIVIPTIGTRGDVQPYLALACGLAKSGHDVTIASHPALRSLVESYGIPFAAIGPDVDLGEVAAQIRGRSRHWALGFLRVMRFTFAILEQAHPDTLAACRGADLVVVSHSAAGSGEADLLGLPTASVTLLPQAIPVSDPSAPVLQRWLGKLAGSLMGLFLSRPLNQLRRRLGLPPLGPTGITSPRLNLLPISPAVYPPHPRWEPRHQMTGYWFADEPAGWQPADNLRSFLEVAEPTIAISLGAMSSDGADAREAAQIAVAAVRRAGVRAVVQGWDRALAELAPPATILPIGPVPHGWLLGRVAALVHHGGFGTTAAGLRAGIPALAIPHIIDQFIWGQRLYELGVGPRPIPRAKLSERALAESIAELVHNSTLRARARALGERIAAERGVASAVRLLEQSFGAPAVGRVAQNRPT